MKFETALLIEILFIIVCSISTTNATARRKDDDYEDEFSAGPKLDRSERNVDAAAEDDEYYVETPNTIRKPGPGRSDSRVSSSAVAPVFGDIALPEDYNIYQIPKHPSGSPMKLAIGLNIRKILDFDELEEQIKIDLEFRVMWTDYKILRFHHHRLNNSVDMDSLPTIENLSADEIRRKKITLNNPNILEKIWKPNLFFENLLLVRQPHIMAKPLTMKFIPEVGWFEYLTRISVTLDCGMEFQYYPADTQSCEFSIRGFSYVRRDLNLSWYNNGVYLEDLKLPSFDVKVDDLHEKFLVDDPKDTDPEAVFDVLAFTIFARRRLSYHLVQTYLASTFYIIITCLCFLLPPRMVEARIGISMTTLLTLTAMFAAVRESTPIVSYVKAIDIWMVGCIFFVFLTLSQFTFYTWLTGNQETLDAEKANEPKKTDEDIKGTGPTTDDHKSDGPNGHSGRKSSQTTNEVEMIAIGQRKRRTPSVFKEATLRKYETWSGWVERFSFPLFLTIFAIYTIIYWSWLLVSADYLDWKVNATLNNVEKSVYRRR